MRGQLLNHSHLLKQSLSFWQTSVIIIPGFIQDYTYFWTCTTWQKRIKAAWTFNWHNCNCLIIMFIARHCNGRLPSSTNHFTWAAAVCRGTLRESLKSKSSIFILARCTSIQDCYSHTNRSLPKRISWCNHSNHTWIITTININFLGYLADVTLLFIKYFLSIENEICTELKRKSTGTCTVYLDIVFIQIEFQSHCSRMFFYKIWK